MTAVCLVAALDRDLAIGMAGQLPWRLPDDLRRFKALTLGKTVLMGRRTAESIGRALPGRRNLVLSRRRDAPYDGQEVVNSLDGALRATGDQDLMIIGGGQIYRLALPLAARLHLTWVETRTNGADTYFPSVDVDDWAVIARESHPADEAHRQAFEFVDYTRVGIVS
jgi:dihydrofolate reductase